MRLIFDIAFRTFSAVILAVAVSLGAFAQPGNNAYSFLEIAESPRSLALGGYAPALVASQHMVAEQNPALLGAEVERVAGLAYMRYYGSANLATLRFSHSAGERGAYSLGIRYLDYGTIEGYDPSGNAIGSFKPNDLLVQGSYSYDFNDRLRGGITAKAVFSNYHDYSAVALAADLGINYYDDEHDLSLSAVIRNAGGQVKRFADEYDHLPFDILLGYMQGLGNGPFSLSITAHHLTRWHLPYYKHSGSSTTGGDAEEEGPSDGKFFTKLFRHLTFGLQYMPSDRFWLAAGYDYKTRTDMSAYRRNFFSGISLGAGVSVSAFDVSVSYSQPHASAACLALELDWWF